MKNAVTLGLDKGHVNGTVAGPHSPVIVASTLLGMTGPIEFYIRCLEGNSASEYQLLHFWQKSDRREFCSVTIGEYGFLAPGAAASSDLASRGKIYTFRIVE